MADDLVINVKQISQYPQTLATGASDRALIQQGGLSGPYASIASSDFVGTALLLGGFLQLAPGGSGGIAFNGAALGFVNGQFDFTEGINAPVVSALEMLVNGETVVTQGWVDDVFAKFVENSVWSFNGRVGAVQLEVEDVMRAGAAPIWSPHFGGHVTAPTSWNLQGNDDTVATLAWVQEWARCSGNVVHTFNGRGGDVVLIADDVSTALTQPGVFGYANTAPSGDASKRIANTFFVDDAMSQVQQWAVGMFTTYGEIFSLQYAPLNSPNFTGLPTAPTANPGTNTGQIATTAFVAAAVVASTTGVSSWNGETGDVVMTGTDITNAGGATLVSPAFTGVPTGPTAAPGNASTQLATCAFVAAAINAIAAGVSSFNTRTGAVVLQTADVTAVGGALLASPAFSGAPTAPTPAGNSNSTAIATTAWVTTALSNVTAGVSSFNGRSGAVALLGADVSAAGGALINSPALTGTPTSTTPNPGDNSQRIATTAFVDNAVAASTAGVSSFNGRSGAVTLGSGDISAAGGALLAGPTFTGIPSAPTAAANTNTTQLATTAFVQTALAAAPGGVSSFNTRTGAITLLGADVSAAGGALLSGPAFTGNPTAPTQTPGTNNTSLATTAFVQAAIATGGGVISFNGRAGSVTLNAADIAAASGALLTVATNPPSAGGVATPNQALWWDNVGGQLYLNYNDGSSTQWVPAAAPAQGQVKATSGNRVLIASQVVTTPVASVQFFGIDNTYDEYEFDCLGFSISASGIPFLRLSTDGSTFVSSASSYTYAWMHVNTNNSTSFAGGAATGINLGAGMSAEATTVGDARIKFTFPTGANRKVLLYDCTWYNSGSGIFRLAGTGGWAAAGGLNPILGIQFLPPSGTVTLGTFKLYGIAR